MIDIHTHLHPPRLFAAIRRWFAILRSAGIERFVFCSYAHRSQMARDLNTWLVQTVYKKREGCARVEHVLERHPNLNVVVAHFGVPDTLDYFELMPTYRNLYLDTTMVFAPSSGGFRAHFHGSRALDRPGYPPSPAGPGICRPITWKNNNGRNGAGVGNAVFRPKLR